MKKKIMILSLCTLGLFALVAFIFNSEVTKRSFGFVASCR